MKKQILFLMASALLVSCGQPSSSSPAASSSASPEASSSSSASSSASSSSASSSSSSTPASSSSSSTPAKGDYLFYNLKEGQTKEGLDGSPWLNVTPAGIAAKVQKPSLQQDFFLSSNYDYLSTVTLQPGQMADGGMIGALNTLQKRYVDLGTGIANKGDYAAVTKKAYELYTASDKSKDLDAVKALITEINGFSTKEQILFFLSSKRGFSFAGSLFTLRKAQNGVVAYEDTLSWTIESSIIPFMNHSETEMAGIVDSFVPLLAYFGYAEDAAKELARTALTFDAEMRNDNSQYPIGNGYKVSELATEFPSFPLATGFKAFGYQDTDTVNFDTSSYRLCKGVNALSNDQLAAFKKDLILRVCIGGQSILPEDLYVQLASVFDQNTRGFPPEMFGRERFVSNARLVFDRCYIDNYETKARKDLLLDLMQKAKAEYKEIVSEATWLGAQTKEKAKEKLEAITFDACYPDYLLQIPSFNLDSSVDTFYKAAQEYRAWSFSSTQPATAEDRIWAGSVTTMNAVYSGMSNSFVVYDGILADTLYTADQVEEIYGSVGAIIGHEISHSIDSQGAQYDKYGTMTDWWTPEDKAAFQAKQAKIVAYWNTLSYKQGVQMWSDIMLPEIIADMGGVSVMLKLASKKANFNYKKFFEAYSASQASVFSSDAIENLYYQGKDTHPMNYLRVNAVLNQFPKFHDVYGVKEGDPMFVKEADRLPIW